MLTDNVLDLIGRTPLIRLRNEPIFAKAEFLNPGGSNVKLVDEVIEVTDTDAIETTRKLGCDHGLLVGISAGANVWAARQIAQKISGNIATVLPDRAERYFSTALI